NYEAKPEDMDGLVEDIRRILREDEGVHQEYMLVNFTGFGEHALEILVYYFTISVKWQEHMDVRQRVNIKIMRAIAARGLAIAVRARNVYFRGAVARAMAGDRDGG